MRVGVKLKAAGGADRNRILMRYALERAAARAGAAGAMGEVFGAICLIFALFALIALMPRFDGDWER